MRKTTLLSIRISALFLLVVLLICSYLYSIDEIGEKSIYILSTTIPVIAFFSSRFYMRLYKKSHLTKIYDALHMPSYERKLRNRNNKEVDEEVLELVKNRKEEIDFLNEKENYRKEFMGNISHELKTPIFLIQSCLETLIDGGIKDPKINIKYLHKALSGTERISQLVEDLMRLSKIESGQISPIMEKFDLNKMIKNVFSELIIKAEASDIKLKSNDNTLRYVYADKNMINQVLINLVSNAITYGKENGFVLVSIHDMNKKYLIEVKDDGIGISEDDTKRIFERFYRVEKSRNRDVGGSGVGLAIVKHIIESHNEKITVNSNETGTSFCFTLNKSIN